MSIINDSYWHIFKNLLITDLLIYKKTCLTKFIDYTIQLIILISITTYVMPSFGLSTSYGLFECAGFLAIIGIWEIYPDVAQLVMDFHNDRHVAYQLTLPLPGWMLWAKHVTFITIKAISLALLTLVIGKIILWNKFVLSTINPYKLALVIIVGSLLYSILTLWAATNIKDMGQMGKLWSRYLFPLWFLGCFQFSFKVIHNLFPFGSYVVLIDPLTYATEATRAAIMGQEGFLPFWWCIAILIICSIFMWLHTLRQLKKRLDLI